MRTLRSERRNLTVRRECRYHLNAYTLLKCPTRITEVDRWPNGEIGEDIKPSVIGLVKRHAKARITPTTSVHSRPVSADKSLDHS